MYREIKHTADVAYEVIANSLEELFKDACKGFFALITDIEKVEKNIEDYLEIEDEDLDFLLHKFLDNLLYKFDVEGKIFCDCDVKIEKIDGKYKLHAKLYGDKIDEKKYEIKILPKSVTWHYFGIKKEDSKYKCQIVIDV